MVIDDNILVCKNTIEVISQLTSNIFRNFESSRFGNTIQFVVQLKHTCAKTMQHKFCFI